MIVGPEKNIVAKREQDLRCPAWPSGERKGSTDSVGGKWEIGRDQVLPPVSFHRNLKSCPFNIANLVLDGALVGEVEDGGVEGVGGRIRGKHEVCGGEQGIRIIPSKKGTERW